MSGVDDLIASFTYRQHALVARWQLRGVGITKRQVDDRVERAALIPFFDGVYRLRGAPVTQSMRWLAAVLAGGDGAFLSHEAAGVLQGYEIRRVRPVVTTPHHRHPELGGITWHRSRRHSRHDIVIVDRIPVASRARTALDLAAVLPFTRLEELVQNAVTSGLLPIESLLTILDRRGGRGVDGTVALRRVLEGGLVDERIEKKLELLIAAIIDGAPIPRPFRQYELTCADGRVVRLDNAWAELRVAVEGDGRRWHGNARQAELTRERSRSIVRTGWEHYVYGWSEATESPLEVRAEVTDVVLARLHRPAAA